MKTSNDSTQILRPSLHFSAKQNWLNDPNGFSYYKGKYHLFYQYNPSGIAWGNMSWGHAISDDLIHWEELDVALLPDKPYDQDGVFSGSAVTIMGRHFLYYTGVETVEEGLKQVQCIATSEDGLTYSKYENNPIMVADHHGDTYDFRDPKMWLHNNVVYMIVASKKSKAGRALIYKSDDGYNFDFVTKFTKKNTGHMWECPDLIEVDQQWLLIFSAMSVEGYPADNVAFIAPVDFDYTTLDTKVHEHELMDYGADFYAPQTMVDNKGRRIVIAWLRMEVPLFKEMQWVGMMTLPREIHYTDSGCHYQVIEEVFANKKNVLYENRPVIDENSIDSPLDNLRKYRLKHQLAYELTLTFDARTEVKISKGDGGGLWLGFNPTSRQVELVRELAHDSEEAGLKQKVTLSRDTFLSPEIMTDQITLQVIIDQSVAEIFINDGRHVISTVFRNSSKNNDLIIEGVLEEDALTLYELDNTSVRI